MSTNYMYQVTLESSDGTVVEETLPQPDTRFASIVYTKETGLFFVQEHPKDDE